MLARCAAIIFGGKGESFVTSWKKCWGGAKSHSSPSKSTTAAILVHCNKKA
jgi:hypothetical protein